MGVKVVTDSGNDLSHEEAAQIGLAVVPVWILFGNDRLRDGIDIDRRRFSQRVAAGEVPTTESPSQEQFRESFARAVDAGHDVVAITLSGRISKSFTNATAAAQAFGSRVHVVDSLASSGLETLLARYAIELAQAGMPAAQIADRVRPAAMKRALFFILSEKTRELMVDAVVRAVGRSPKTRVTFGHIQNETGAKELQRMLTAHLGKPPAKEYVQESSPTIAVHQGPGSVSIAAIAPE